MSGNPIGAVVFLLLYNVPAFLVRYFGVMKGYELGTSLLEKIQKSGLMDKVTNLTGIVGLMTIGSMIATMVSVKVPLTFGTGDGVTELQGILDSIMPCLLPVCVTAIIYWILGKNVKTTWLLVGIIVVSILLAWMGILGA